MLRGLRQATHPIMVAATPSVQVHKMAKMDNYLDGSWEMFEQWIRNTIGSDFCWRVRPMDQRANRQMIAELVENDIKENDGVFPENNSFIERK